MSAIWASDTNVSTIGGASTILYPGDQVPTETTWLSPSGQFRLWFQADGNLVLYDESTSAAIWASDTAELDADTLIMQEDGNLVIYEGGIFGTPLWSTETADHEGAYLVLQNDGNLVLYDTVGLQNYAVFTVKPDWGQPITETLEWLTSVTESPNAVEQRMGLRISPRQKFEIGYVLFGPKRTYFDALTMAGGGSPLYLPLWHDCGFLDTDVSAGASALNIDTRWTEFQNCNFLVLMKDEFNYELAEISAYTDSTITLNGPLNASWPFRTTRVYPVKQVYIEQQPSGDRFADRAGRFRLRFVSMEPNKSNAVSPLGTFMSNYVLETEPNEADSLRYSYDRKMYIIDEKTGIPLLSDVAPFLLQTHSWFAKGRQRASELRGVLYALMGRRVPIWIPSFYSDFELIDTTLAAGTTLHVKRCGYTDIGGPFKNREYILIHMRDGTRLYRKIVAASIVGAEGVSEDLLIDSAPTHDLTPDNILRISFLSFSRLDQDSVELTHHTSSKGVTTSNLVFRTDPGIDGVSSETIFELPPFPDDPPGPIVIDPFKVPDQVRIGYSPFGSLGVAEPPAPDPTTYSFVGWQQFLTDEEVGFPDDLIIVETGNHLFHLPLTGSFRVSLKTWFDMDFGIPHFLKFRLVFFNTTLDPIEVQIELEGESDDQIVAVGSDRYRTVGPLVIPITSRRTVASVVDDPDLPIGIEAQFITAGWVADTGGPILGMNIFPEANDEADPLPYADGDAFIKIEWWS